jgi:hypothetical protein
MICEEHAKTEPDEQDAKVEIFFNVALKLIGQHLDTKVASFPHCETGSYPAEPKKNISCQFFTPGEGVVKYVPHDDLDEDEDSYEGK